jgi:hypothetical protein
MCLCIYNLLQVVQFDNKHAPLQDVIWVQGLTVK